MNINTCHFVKIDGKYALKKTTLSTLYYGIAIDFVARQWQHPFYFAKQ
jgi:hypothetical protein